MLYEALTGARPFSGSPADVLKRKELLDAPRPRDRISDVPPKLDLL